MKSIRIAVRGLRRNPGYAALAIVTLALGIGSCAAVFTLLPEVLRASANWRYIVFAGALIILMALRPEGLITGRGLRRLFAKPGP